MLVPGHVGDLATLGVTVVGVSGDYVHSHRAWAKDLDLPFMLLSDHDHGVAKAYESYDPSTGFNLRTIFVVYAQRDHSLC